METNVTRLLVFKSLDNGLWYWHAQAGNNEIVAQSEAFTTKEDAKRAVEAVFPGIEIDVIEKVTT